MICWTFLYPGQKSKILHSNIFIIVFYCLILVTSASSKNQPKEVQTHFRFCSKGEEWLILKLVMQPKNSEATTQPEFINMCFTMATYVFIVCVEGKENLGGRGFFVD